MCNSACGLRRQLFAMRWTVLNCVPCTGRCCYAESGDRRVSHVVFAPPHGHGINRVNCGAPDLVGARAMRHPSLAHILGVTPAHHRWQSPTVAEHVAVHDDAMRQMWPEGRSFWRHSVRSWCRTTGTILAASVGREWSSAAEDRAMWRSGAPEVGSALPSMLFGRSDTDAAREERGRNMSRARCAEGATAGHCAWTVSCILDSAVNKCKHASSRHMRDFANCRISCRHHGAQHPPKLKSTPSRKGTLLRPRRWKPLLGRPPGCGHCLGFGRLMD